MIGFHFLRQVDNIHRCSYQSIDPWIIDLPHGRFFNIFEEGKIVDVIIDYNFADVEHVDVKNATHKIIKSIDEKSKKIVVEI